MYIAIASLIVFSNRQRPDVDRQVLPRGTVYVELEL